MRIQTAVKMMKTVLNGLDKDFTIWEYREEIKELLKCGVFVEHIENHLSTQYPGWQVKCKICNKDIDRIYKEWETLAKKLKHIEEQWEV